MTKMKSFVVVGVLAFLLGMLFGWKIHELRVSRLKSQRDYHKKMATELDKKF